MPDVFQRTEITHRTMTQSDTPDFAYTPLITRLSYYFGVPSKDMAALDELPCEARCYGRGDVIMERGRSVTSFILVTSGWAARTRYTRAWSAPDHQHPAARRPDDA